MRLTTAYIVTPVYNARQYIRANVISVNAQFRFYPHIVHIIIDDCSTDGTLERLKARDIRHDRRYILQNQRHGSSAVGTFVSGLKFVERTFTLNDYDVVFWLDGDDWLCDDRAIEKTIKVYQASQDIEMCYSDHLSWKGCGNMNRGYSHPMPDRTMVRYARVAYSHLRSFKWTMLEYVDDWRLRDPRDQKYWKFAGDSAFFLPMLEVAKRVHYIQEPFVIYNEERGDNEWKKDWLEQQFCSVKIRTQPPNTNNRREVWSEIQFAPVRRFKLYSNRSSSDSCKICQRNQKMMSCRPCSCGEVEVQVAEGQQRGNRMCDIVINDEEHYEFLLTSIKACNKHGVVPSIITHWENIVDKLEQLWNLGTHDILFSLHGTRDHHNEIAGTKQNDGFSRLIATMEKCVENDFSFGTDTMLTSHNYTDLPELLSIFIKVRPYISTFTIFEPSHVVNAQHRPPAMLSDYAPYLKEAINVLVDKGVLVNIINFPFCLLKGYEKYIVNSYQRPFDPYGCDCGATPKTYARYKQLGNEFALKTDLRGARCSTCLLAGTVCSGLNIDYLKSTGDGELDPYHDVTPDGPFFFRKNADVGSLYTFVGQNHEWHIEKKRELERMTATAKRDEEDYI